MIKSMTGFGKSEFEINNRKVTIEIKSLNSKQSDVNTRIPQLYREKEIDIRRMINDHLVRGKIDVSIYVESLGDSGNAIINEAIAKSYFSSLAKISDDLGIPVNDRTLQIAMRLPDTVKMQYEQLEESEWELLKENIYTALLSVDSFRRQEGIALERDLKSNIDQILMLLSMVEPFEIQ
jgi:uncharacterized protein (TIGR00255 family)